MPRESRAVRARLQAVVYRYHVPGPLPAQAVQEIRRAHVLRNAITEVYRQTDEAVAGIYAGVPGVATAAAAKDAAAEQVKELRDQVSARKAADRTRTPDPELAAKLKEARAGLTAARGELRTAKDHARDVVRPAVQEAAAAAEAKIKALYPAATGGSLFAGDPLLPPGSEGALYWATWNMVRDQQNTAHQRVLDARAHRRPAELRFRRWDGTGTVTAQLQRALQAKTGGSAVITFTAASPEDLTEVPVAWQVAGDGCGHVSVTSRCTRDEETGLHTWEAVVVNEGDADADVTCAANLTPLLGAGAEVTASPDAPVPLFLGEDGVLSWEGTLKGGLPFRTRAVLGDAENGPWRNVALLLPAGAADMPSKGPYRDAPPVNPGALSEKEWAGLPYGVRSRAALRFRVGAGDAAELVMLPFRYHRPIPDDAEVTQVQLTVHRDGHHHSAALAVTVLLPGPEPRTGDRVAAVHTGWRAMEDGSLRVAVIAGAGGAPPDIRWRNERTGERQPGLVDHGTWQEVVIPAAARDLMAKARSLQGIRDRNLPGARQQVTAFLARLPDARPLVDPRGTLEMWKSPGRFREALRVMEDLGAGLPEVLELRDWARQDLHLEDWMTGNETRFRRWRKNLFATVAAWVTGGADAVVTDSWDAGRRKPGTEEEDTAQEAAGRSNAVLASPGELRGQVATAARRRGVDVRAPAVSLGGVHHGCPASPPGTLPAEDRAAGVAVTCTGCGRTLDQDLVMALAMMTAPDAAPPG